ncbi:MAG: acetyltransferase [Sporichthyaceae bacterium]|nr:acetyltransferase [Sporichthyaceae bacterium]
MNRFTLRRLDLARDLGRVHRWMNDPEVARYWDLAEPVDEVAAYLSVQAASVHSSPYLGFLREEAMSYWELYRADLDALARFYPARPHDAGVHLLIGPPEYRGKGLAAPMLRAVCDWLYRQDALCTRVVAEPDADNIRSVRAFERAGFVMSGEVVLPGKTAALMVHERGDTDVG